MGGLFDKGGDPPPAPDYKGEAIATANSQKWDEVGPTGTIGWTLRPGADPNNPKPGDAIRTTTLSPEQQALYNAQTKNQQVAGSLASQLFGQFGNGQEATQDAIYNQATRYYDDRFGDQESQLRTRLQNQGVTEGSAAWGNAFENFNQNRDSAYADAADRAVTGADAMQSNQINRIAQIMALARGQMPESSNNNVSPTDFSGAASKSYEAELNRYNAEKAQKEQQMQSLGNMAAMFFL